MEHHVGGHSLLAGLFPPPALEGGEQGAVHAVGIDGILAADRATGRASLLLRRRQRQLQAGFTPQQRPHQRLIAEAQSAAGFGRRLQVAEAAELAQHGAPLAAIELAADAVHAQLVVAEGADPFAVGPQQNVHHVGRTEALAGAVHRRKRLLGRHRGVAAGLRIEAAIAVAAVGLELLAEVAQQQAAPAAGRFGEADQRIELAVLDPLLLLGGAGVVDEAAQLRDVAAAMHHPGHRRQAVTAGPARFLVVGLQALGQIHMRHEAHIRLVDAHAEGDRGHHHHGAAKPEPLQRCSPLLRFQSGVICDRIKTRRLQLGAEPIHPRPGAGVDDARRTAMLLEKWQQLTAQVVERLHAVADVGPIEAGQEHLALLQAQSLADVLAGAGIGRGGEGEPRHLWEACRQLIELAVFGAEIVAPLRDAMGFVDREQADRQGCRQTLEQVAAQQPLRRHVQQLQRAATQLPPYAAGLLRLQAGMQCCSGNAGLLQRLHLVLHQGDQGRDHHRQSGQAEGRHLIAERFAATGGHQHQARATTDHMAHDRLLRPAEVGVAEHAAQHRLRLGRLEGSLLLAGLGPHGLVHVFRSPTMAGSRPGA